MRQATGVLPGRSWEYFNRAYCISVEDRADRRAEAARQFDAVGLGSRVEFLIVRKDLGDPERGIHASHMECFRRGIRAGAQTILVFEDDVVFDRFDPGVLADGIRFMQASDWNMFFFGCLTLATDRTPNRSVLNVRYRSLTHAYAVRREFAAALLAHPWEGRPYDMLLRTRCDRYFAAYPSFAFQSDSRSDNLRLRKMDRMRRLFGGLARVQKFDEFYHRHRLVLIGLNALVTAGLLAFAALG